MADLILHKRSSTASAVPSAGSIALGELAINTADARLFLKKGDGTVVDVTSIGGIQGLTAALAGKEPSITAGTSAQFWRGDKTWQSFGDATRAQTLAGLPTPTNVAIANTDAILAAMAKLQGQVTARMTNPMTTAGDMIRGGTSGAPERLALGSEGAMLIAGGSAPGYGNNPRLAGYSEPLETMANNAIDVSTGNVKKRVLTANATFTITGATTGRASSFTLLLEAGASYTVAWPGSFKWLGGVPTLTAKDVITGFSVDGGTQWIVSYAGSYV